MEIEKLLQVYSFKQLQETKTVLLLLTKNDITNEEYLEYIYQKQQELTKANSSPPIMLTKTCPDCSEEMNLHPGDDNDSQWVCAYCRYSQYDTRSVAQVWKEEKTNGN